MTRRRSQVLMLPSVKRTAGDLARLAVPEYVPPIRSARAAAVARLFGLPDAKALSHAEAMRPTTRRLVALDVETHLPAPGRITLVMGPSGAGKSSLLKRLRRIARPSRSNWIDLARLRLPNRVPLVDCFGEAESLTDILLDLGRVGLGEAWSYLRTPAELSDGQRWRLRLAVALRRAASGAPNDAAPTILAADEFAALLDRVTAAVVARCLRRAIDASCGVSAVVATSHEDLVDALRPDVVVSCDFGAVEVRHPAYDDPCASQTS